MKQHEGCSDAGSIPASSTKYGLIGSSLIRVTASRPAIIGFESQQAVLDGAAKVSTGIDSEVDSSVSNQPQVLLQRHLWKRYKTVTANDDTFAPRLALVA